MRWVKNIHLIVSVEFLDPEPGCTDARKKKKKKSITLILKRGGKGYFQPINLL